MTDEYRPCKNCEAEGILGLRIQQLAHCGRNDIYSVYCHTCGDGVGLTVDHFTPAEELQEKFRERWNEVNR
jgi:hypothetical protein